MDHPVRYATDVKPLFRYKDVHSMRFACNLDDYGDVIEHWVRGGKQP